MNQDKKTAQLERRYAKCVREIESMVDSIPQYEAMANFALPQIHGLIAEARDRKHRLFNEILHGRHLRRP